MVTGYLLIPPDSAVDAAIYERYMQLRHDELGYSILPPELHIPLHPLQTQLKRASPVVETLAEAERFLIRLQIELPQYGWQIKTLEFPDAERIDWRRAR